MEMIISEEPIHREGLASFSTFLSTSFFPLENWEKLAREFLFSFSNFSYQLCVNFTSKYGNIQLFTWWMILFSFDFYLSRKYISNPPIFKNYAPSVL